MWTDNEIRRNFVLYKYQSESHVDSVLLNSAIINAKQSFLIEFNNYGKDYLSLVVLLEHIINSLTIIFI